MSLSHEVISREKYQDTPRTLSIYQNAPRSFKFTKLPLCPKKYTLQSNHTIKTTSPIYQNTLGIRRLDCQATTSMAEQEEPA